MRGRGQAVCAASWPNGQRKPDAIRALECKIPAVLWVFFLRRFFLKGGSDRAYLGETCHWVLGFKRRRARNRFYPGVGGPGSM